jgi:hypothetical protein
LPANENRNKLRKRKQNQMRQLADNTQGYCEKTVQHNAAAAPRRQATRCVEAPGYDRAIVVGSADQRFVERPNRLGAVELANQHLSDVFLTLFKG